MIYEFFRMIGMILGYPLQLIFFKRRTYFEGKRNRSFKRGGKLIITNHFNMLDYVMTCFLVFPRRLNAVASEDPFKRPLFRFGMKFFTASSYFSVSVTRSIECFPCSNQTIFLLSLDARS